MPLKGKPYRSALGLLRVMAPEARCLLSGNSRSGFLFQSGFPSSCIISFVDGLDFISSDLAPGIQGEAEGRAIQGEAEGRDIQAEGKADIDMKGEFLAVVG